MMLSVLLIVIVSSVAWSCFDLCRKRLAGRLEPVTAVIVLMLGQIPVFAAFELLSPPSEQTFAWAFLGPAVLSILLNVGSNLMFLRSVELAPFSLAIPMLSFTPVFGALGGYIFLQERLSFQQIGGVIAVIIGTLILDGGARIDVKNTEHIRARRGVALMLVVALIWSITSVVDKIGLRSSGVAFYAGFQCAGVAVFSWLWLFIKKQKIPWRSIGMTKKDLSFAIIAAAIALLTQFVAIREMPVGLFEALKRAFGLAMALIFGYWFFREAITVRKTIALLIVASGMAAILI